MTQPTDIRALSERLTGLLADWGSELATVLKELDERRARVVELESRVADVEALQQRLDGQNTLIETLKTDAEEALKLRGEVRNRDLELERVNSELESKKDLVKALRRDSDGSDKVKAEIRQKDREIEDLRTQLEDTERRLTTTTAELNAMREAVAGAEDADESELEALRSELEARKTVIKSLRADQERAAALQASLDEKRDTIEQLEGAISRHAMIAAELRRTAETWKRKYQALKTDSGMVTATVNVPLLSAADVYVAEDVDKLTPHQPETTIAIDMRRSLLEARRTVGKVQAEK